MIRLHSLHRLPGFLRKQHPFKLARRWDRRKFLSSGGGIDTKLFKDKHATEPMDSQHLYQYLDLHTFSKEEIQATFKLIHDTSDDQDKNGESEQAITEKSMQVFLEKRIQEMEDKNNQTSLYDGETTLELRRQYSNIEAKRCWELLKSNQSQGELTEKEFIEAIEKNAKSLDSKRLLPLTLSMILVGSSVGVVTPAMPFVVQKIGLTAGEYGLVVSAFALAKMTGNIPSAVLVERYGRKPYLVYTMVLISMGVGGIGLAGSFEQLYLCRLFTGLGVAGLSTAATMTVTDISTPLNRASTFAPIMSAFAAGTALGPAIGGIACDLIGISPTFYMVGVSYVGLAALNQVLLTETKPSKMEFPWNGNTQDDASQVSIRESFQAALGQWVPLLSRTEIRNVCIMNGFYWVALAGSQMTLLPLILTDPEGLAMTATNVGQVYMGMSVVQVLGNPVLAQIVDRIGKVPGIVAGCTLISSAMATLPYCTDPYELAGVLVLWASGSSLLSISPMAFVSDRVDDTKRAQAIALLRTSGDVGFLIGASSMGALADWTSSLDLAMQSSSGILLTATGWFAARSILNAQLAKEEK